MKDLKYDLIVIGGGPGGSSVATFVAKAGHRVLLLEKEKFPRYQIGESLLPATVQGICGLLGVKEEIESAGFTPKRGGTFVWGKSPEPWTFNFEESAIKDQPSKASALQVERSRFDEILLNNARKNGVEVFENCTVKDVISDKDRFIGVDYKSDSASTINALGRYIIDASGHTSKFHQHVGERIYSQLFKNVAIYGYFRGGKRLPHPNEGNILSAAFESGWIWYIPLSDELTSVGVVLDREKVKELDDVESEYYRNIQACSIIKELLSEAERMTDETYGKLRVRRDYSYNSTRYWHNGMALVGDTACFIDPVFSSGVHLATFSGLLAARSINTALEGMIDEERCFKEFEMRYRSEYGNFYNFLMAFYDIEQEKEDYFWTARKILNTEEKSNQAFIRLISGLSTEGLTMTTDSVEEFFEARTGFGEVFKNHLIEKPDTSESNSAINMDEFMKGFTKEVVELQMHAKLQELGLGSDLIPLSHNRLTVTDDFLHWKSVAT